MLNGVCLFVVVKRHIYFAFKWSPTGVFLMLVLNCVFLCLSCLNSRMQGLKCNTTQFLFLQSPLHLADKLLATEVAQHGSVAVDEKHLWDRCKAI